MVPGSREEGQRSDETEALVMVWRRGECDGRMGFESFNFISSTSVWGL